MFFDVGLIILIPLVYGLAQRTGRSMLFSAVPLLAGRALTHAFIPPTPGPIGIASLIGADLGWIILFGAVAGIPALIIGGVLHGHFIGSRIDLAVPVLRRDPPRLLPGRGPGHRHHARCGPWA